MQQQSVKYREVELTAPDSPGMAGSAPCVSGLHLTHRPVVSAAPRHATPATEDVPITAMLRTFLSPTVVVIVLFAATAGHGEAFTGYDLVLAVLAFFISSQTFGDLELYRSGAQLQLVADIRKILFAWSLVVAIVFFLGYASGLRQYFAPPVLVTWFVATPFVLLLAHRLARLALHRMSASKALMRTMVLVGVNRLGLDLVAKVRQDPYLCIDVKGVFDDREPKRLPDAAANLLTGKLHDVPEFVRANNIDRIYVSLPMIAKSRIGTLLESLRDTTASVYFLPDIFSFDPIQARFENIDGIPVVAVRESPFYGLNSVLKRTFDLVLSALLLLSIGPLLLLIALAVKLTSPGPAIFKQRRYGLNGEEIMVYKFRTMTVCEDGATQYRQVKRDDSRVTPIGNFLRASSLDELPQFINVLQGTMSIVGPRPHAIAVNEQYRKLISGYMIRHKVKPGITGWAQINGYRGGDDLESMRGRIEHDLEYLKNWSLALDLWIILRTAWLVVRDRNAF
jgi:putative colanic acid biosysnthesis UDP-glucose lipid carrier transferase